MEHQDRTAPPVEFTSFVTSLAATAAITLQQVEGTVPGQAPGDADDTAKAASPEEQAGRARRGLANARHLIDTLAMLEEKTRGNLSDDERDVLQTSLAQLRLRFVQVSDRVRRGGGPPPGTAS